MRVRYRFKQAETPGEFEQIFHLNHAVFAGELEQHPAQPGERLIEPGPAATGLSIVALSPDGRYLAYVATRGGAQQIFLRAMDNPETCPDSYRDASPDAALSGTQALIDYIARRGANDLVRPVVTPRLLNVCRSLSRLLSKRRAFDVPRVR